MTIQITILGLRQVGASIGLALAKEKERIVRVGSDRQMDIARRAEKLGAIDKMIYNLIPAVEKADVIIMALPVEEMKETLETIATAIKPGAVIVDTSVAVQAGCAWAKDCLPPDRYFVSALPALNPVRLKTLGVESEEAFADLFEKSVMMICTPPGTHESAINLAADLASLLGATPLFSDPLEVGGLLAAVHFLPELTACALLNATITQPGWREARKVAGTAYSWGTEASLHLPEVEELGKSALLNADATARMIDMLIRSLVEIRQDLLDQDAAHLKQTLTAARDGRNQWFSERVKADWEAASVQTTDLPGKGEMLGNLFGFRGSHPKKK